MNMHEFSNKLHKITANMVRYKFLAENEIDRSMIDHKSKNMKTVSLLAGGIAHDYNNILTSIIGSASIAMNNLHGNDPSYKYFEQINKMAVRAADLTRQLLLISCKHPIIPTLLNLNLFIEELIANMNISGGNHVNITTDLEKELWKVKADAANIRQILINLCDNAYEAMPDGGTISFRTRNIVLSNSDCDLIMESRPGNFVCLSITDSGTGMAQNIRQKIFEPLFTTKADKFSGLGLTVVSGVVHHYEGWLTVTSSEEKGSEFCIYLPADKKD